MFSRYIKDKTEDNIAVFDSENCSDDESNTQVTNDDIKKEPLQHRSFTSVMETMNTKFSYQDGKLSTALDVISWYLK